MSTTYDPTPYRPPRVQSPSRLSIWGVVRYMCMIIGTLLIIHLTAVTVAPDHPYTTTIRSAWSPSPQASGSPERPPMAGVRWTDVHEEGGFRRDSYPMRTILAFWDLAQREVAARGLNTCDDQLGRRFIDAYHETDLSYCTPGGQALGHEDIAAARKSAHNLTNNLPSTLVTCSAIQRNAFISWWPYPAAPCISTNLRLVKGERKAFRTVGCEVTAGGVELDKEMGKEDFLGLRTTRLELDDPDAVCMEFVNHTAILVGRQDQWNPFHVAEDLITTVVTILLAARNAPELIDTRAQLIFLEGFGMDQNHFTPLWDRMGAWAPRRLSLDPWDAGVCLTNAIHSVGAGASFLSGMGVGESYQCASTVTWAASHYYRSLFGLMPWTDPVPVPSVKNKRPINMLWLSRSKLDAYAKKHNDWSKWRGVRHLYNEPALMDRIRLGISEFCHDRQDGFGCHFQDALEEPESWAESEVLENDQAVPIRFTSIDPTVHTLGTQIHYVGHATVLVSSHGGALGLSLFLPPGRGVVMELQVKDVDGNYHFEHMAYEMGHVYQMLRISADVNVDMVWGALKDELERLLA